MIKNKGILCLFCRKCSSLILDQAKNKYMSKTFIWAWKPVCEHNSPVIAKENLALAYTPAATYVFSIKEPLQEIQKLSLELILASFFLRRMK